MRGDQHSFRGELALAWLGLLLVSCDGKSPELSEVGPTSGDGEVAAAFEWQRDPATGLVAQLAKHPEDLATNPALVLLESYPNNEAPDEDISSLDILRCRQKEIASLLQSRNWVIIDVRKDSDILETGTIPGARHFEYKFDGAAFTGTTQLAAEMVQDLLVEFEGVIFACNGPKCPRSFNASVIAVQKWNVPGERVRWFRDGIPSWTRGPLIPLAQEGVAAPESSS